VRILHLSLDLFVEPLPRWAGAGRRLPEPEFRIGSPEEVERFLRAGCGLPPKTSGRVVDEHQGAYAVLREWVETGALTPPFDLVHADAHSCLGSGDEGWHHVLGTLMHLPVEQRARPDPLRITPENWLLFAAAAGWIRSLDLVVHPAWTPDVLPVLFENRDPRSGRLRLAAYDRNHLALAFEMPELEFPPAVAAGEPVPLRVGRRDDVRDLGPFDRVVVSRAPSYTPPAADHLAGVVGEYLANDDPRDRPGPPR
jgi:hypothetical protein